MSSLGKWCALDSASCCALNTEEFPFEYCQSEVQAFTRAPKCGELSTYSTFGFCEPFSLCPEVRIVNFSEVDEGMY